MNPNEWIRKFESLITPFMRENGVINGKALRNAIKFCKPEILNVVTIPDEDFSLPTLTDDIVSSFSRKEVN